MKQPARPVPGSTRWKVGTIRKNGQSAFLLRPEPENKTPDWLFSPVPWFEFSHDEIDWKPFESAVDAVTYIMALTVAEIVGNL